MKLSRSGFCFLTLASFMLLILIFTTPVFASTRADQNIYNHRLVMQIIDNRFHKWLEYYDPLDNSLSITLLEPDSRELTSEEVIQLLYKSRQWERENLDIYSSSFTLNQEGITDNRTAVDSSLATAYPNNTIGFLSIIFPESYMRGTAFLVSPHTALTNGHNVYSDPLGGWFVTLRFSPGQYETQWPETVQPYSTLSPVSVETNDSYIRYENEGDRDNSVNHDYAALFFRTPFSGINTFIPLEFNHIPEELIVIGYPGVIRGSNSLGQWRSEGKLVEQDRYCLFYDAFTSPGNSGSPVIVYNQQADTYRVVAIHTFNIPDLISGGPQLNSRNQLIIERWLKWTPEQLEQAKEKPPGLGDVNDDQVINIIDVTLILQHALWLTELDKDMLDRADINRDGTINVQDVTLAMQYSLKLIDTL
ncbi:MAG: dockerin type I domain-containing protein [Bacillota bacterium]|nr:dockerin type I domain-containing protein [Bacillota bacterium]